MTRRYQPTIIIHGGAGNITTENLPDTAWKQYKASLEHIVRGTYSRADTEKYDAIDLAAYAVTQLENDPLFNSGKGAVFNKAGEIELEASLMVSRGTIKRYAAVSMLKHVKSPITLAKEILKRSNDEDRGGAQGHVHLSGPEAERLALEYDLDIVDQSYFWTRKRWEEHKKGLNRVVKADVRPDGSAWASNDPSWNGRDYLPQGTVGAVVMDHQR